jgi:hypothetical protein
MKRNGLVESYIVRIYRRDERNSTRVHGIVEQVGSNRSRSFNSMRELVVVLGAPSSTDTKARQR